jgi:hypothetical protein
LRVDRQGALNLSDSSGQPFTQDALQNPHNRAILERLPSLKLADAWLVAGCLFQTVWNLRSGRAPTAGIKDYDLFYFDAADLSADAEMAVQARVDACYADLGITLEIKNQARVHTWYPDYFGRPYPPLTRSQDGLDRFLVQCTCVGLQAADEGLVLYAPNGLDELYRGVLRPNPLCDHRALFEEKAASYQARWSWLETRV